MQPKNEYSISQLNGQQSKNSSGPTDHVVLVDDDGSPIGTADRLVIHTDSTPLHLAFSTYLFGPDGRLLITRRALSKKTWPGVWTNSACGHLRSGETPLDAARRRVTEELGAVPTDLKIVLPNFRYRATDASGVVENEICPVMIGRISSELSVDPEEIAEYAFVEWADFCDAIQAVPSAFSPWAHSQVDELAGMHPLAVVPVEDLTHFRGMVDEQAELALDDVERRWNQHVGAESLDILPVDLPQWARKLFTNGGKRFRTTMVWWGFVAGGGLGFPGRVRDAARAAAALELLHVFALVHDDVMDSSDVRRGEPAAHAQAQEWHRRLDAFGDSEEFGTSIAILLGDFLHSLADSVVDKLPGGLRECWYDINVELLAGQRADLTGSAAQRSEIGIATQVAELKSGAYTIVRSLDLGARAARAGDATLTALREYGMSLGRAFAWRDDIIGVWGDTELSGKPAGDDLITRKPTIILALGADRLSPEGRRRLDSLDADASPSDIHAVAAELEALGVRDQVEKLIDEEARSARASLANEHIDTRAAAGLTAAIEKIAWRYV